MSDARPISASPSPARPPTSGPPAGLPTDLTANTDTDNQATTKLTPERVRPATAVYRSGELTDKTPARAASGWGGGQPADPPSKTVNAADADEQRTMITAAVPTPQPPPVVSAPPTSAVPGVASVPPAPPGPLAPRIATPPTQGSWVLPTSVPPVSPPSVDTLSALSYRLDYRTEQPVEAPAESNGTKDKSKKKKKTSLFPGAGFTGGRWKRFAFNGVVLLALGVLILNGIYRLAGRALYDPPPPPPGQSFPREAAMGYVQRFIYTYYTVDPDQTEQRDNQLALFFPNEDSSNRLDVDGDGKQTVLQAVSDGIRVVDDNHATVAVAALIDDEPLPANKDQKDQAQREDKAPVWVCMQVAVQAKNDREIAILSYPSLVSCVVPPGADVPTPDLQEDENTDIAETIEEALDDFFVAYASGSPDELNPVTTSDSTVVSGLGGTVQFDHLLSPKVYLHDNGADDSRRDVQVQVGWRTPSGLIYTAEYLLVMRVVDDQWQTETLSGAVPNEEFAPKQGGPVESSVSPTGDANETSS